MQNFGIIVFIFLAVAFSSSCTVSKSNAVKPLNHETSVSKELYAEIAQMDSVLFNAYNTRDIAILATIFSEDLEFYHDLGGVTGYGKNMESFKKLFAGDRKVRRELVRSSLEVYPIKDYGAVETGTHRFYGTEKGQQEKLGSEARFVQVWKKVNDQWKVTRVISYAHHEY